MRKFKLFEFKGFVYFKGTKKTFGLQAALTQLSPLINTIIHRKIVFNY